MPDSPATANKPTRMGAIGLLVCAELLLLRAGGLPNPEVGSTCCTTRCCDSSERWKPALATVLPRQTGCRTPYGLWDTMEWCMERVEDVEAIKEVVENERTHYELRRLVSHLMPSSISQLSLLKGPVQFERAAVRCAVHAANPLRARIMQHTARSA